MAQPEHFAIDYREPHGPSVRKELVIRRINVETRKANVATDASTVSDFCKNILLDSEDAVYTVGQQVRHVRVRLS